MIYSLKKTAELAGTSRQRLHQLIQTGRLPRPCLVHPRRLDWRVWDEPTALRVVAFIRDRDSRRVHQGTRP